MNAMVLVLILVALAAGALMGWLIRTLGIKGKETELEKAAEAARAKLESAEAERAKAELALADLQTQAQAEAERLRRQAADEAEKLRQKAADDIEHAKEAARQEEREHYETLLKQTEATAESLREALEKRHIQEVEAQEQRHSQAVKALNEKFAETIATMRQEVTNTTRELLDQRQKEFSTSSLESLNRIMQPLQENLERMQKTVQDNTEKATGFNGEMKAGIESIIRQSQAAKDSADRLANALNLGAKVQGHFGERILSELLQSSGLKEGINFETQCFIREDGERIAGDDGTGLQPDVILHIDKSHHVIIDAKVSLTAFYSYTQATTKEERDRALKDHLNSLKGQVKKLAAKDYSKYLKGSIDYVIMFVPITQALYLATEADPTLWREAMEKKVYIADEQTLYAALKIIDLNWRQQAQAENHEQVYRLAGEMLDRVGAFMDRYGEVGKALESARAAYDKGLDKITEGGQSINTTCHKLIGLGAQAQKKSKGLSATLLKGPDELE